MYTLQLNTSRIHPNSKKRDQNISPSNVAAFLYKSTYLCFSSVDKYYLHNVLDICGWGMAIMTETDYSNILFRHLWKSHHNKNYIIYDSDFL